MNDGMYRLIGRVLDLLLWRGKLIGEENLPKRGPAVFISNHLNATGPIAACCSIPVRVHPWIMADDMDKDLAPLFLQADFVERQLHFTPPVSRWLSRAICSISVPFLNSLGCIPVYRSDYEGLRKTLEISMGVLREGKFVLIFPEDPRLPADPVTKMNPFMHGFVRLAEMYYAQTGECLEFYPVMIHSSRHLVVGKPVVFNPLNSVGMERRRLKDLMEDTIIAMYMQMEGGDTSGKLTLQPKKQS
jgi:1-acyl-sn-glycerol-3-phosphate acyltransferase